MSLISCLMFLPSVMPQRDPLQDCSPMSSTARSSSPLNHQTEIPVLLFFPQNPAVRPCNWNWSHLALQTINHLHPLIITPASGFYSPFHGSWTSCIPGCSPLPFPSVCARATGSGSRRPPLLNPTGERTWGPRRRRSPKKCQEDNLHHRVKSFEYLEVGSSSGFSARTLVVDGRNCRVLHRILHRGGGQTEVPRSLTLKARWSAGRPK